MWQWQEQDKTDEEAKTNLQSLIEEDAKTFPANKHTKRVNRWQLM